MQIADMPYSGRKVPEYKADDVRDLIEYPYRVISRIKIGQIHISVGAPRRMSITG